MQQKNSKPLKVLYLEDEALIALDGEAILNEMGFSDVSVVMSLEDAKSAVDAKEFDLALLDINLGGGKTSFSLADTLRAKGVPLIFLSGYTATEGLTRNLDAPLVSKPFDEHSLRHAIEKALDGAAH